MNGLSAEPDERWYRLLHDVGTTLERLRTHAPGQKLIVCSVPAPRMAGDIFVTTPRDMRGG